MNVISVICYKPDGIDTCRGCVMDRYSADFDMEVFDDPKEAAFYTARKTHENRYKEHRSPDWATIILINGKVASYNDYCNPGYDLDNGEDSGPENGLYNLFKGYFEQAEQQLKEEREKALAQEAEKQQKAKIKASKDIESQRRQMYETLKKEFG